MNWQEAFNLAEKMQELLKSKAMEELEIIKNELKLWQDEWIGKTIRVELNLQQGMEGKDLGGIKIDAKGLECLNYELKEALKDIEDMIEHIKRLGG